MKLILFWILFPLIIPVFNLYRKIAKKFLNLTYDQKAGKN